MKKILFIVNGLGLGNSTRCESIIKFLIAKGIKVDILTSNNGKYYFKKQNCYSFLYEFKSFYYAKNMSGELSIWRTILNIPKFIIFFFHNVRFLKNLIRTNNYNGVVIDSDYTILLLKRWIKIPVFALNNACIVVGECKKLNSIPKEIKMQYLIEKCDNWFHQIIPDIVLIPSLSFNTFEKKKSFYYLPPFIREGLKVRDSVHDLKRILVMFSGSQFKMSTNFLIKMQKKKGIKIDVVGREGESNSWIQFHGKIYNNKDIINNADIMVINSGYSAISEAVVLCKPIIVIPVPNHAEQYINATTIEKAGLGLVANIRNVEEKINEMIMRFPEYVEKHRSFNCSRNGAQLAADIIKKEIEKY